MRRHRHSRPKHRTIASPTPRPEGLGDLAAASRYVGSPEHKRYPSPSGHPALRSDASECEPRYSDFEAITQVVRVAIRRGCISAIMEGGFPKYVWGWLDDQLYEARHINGPIGTYKAYPLEGAERPLDPEGMLNWEEQDA